MNLSPSRLAAVIIAGLLAAALVGLGVGAGERVECLGVCGVSK